MNRKMTLIMTLCAWSAASVALFADEPAPPPSAPVAAHNGCEDLYDARQQKGYSKKEVEQMKAQVVKDMKDNAKDSAAVKAARAELRQVVHRCDVFVQKNGSTDSHSELMMTQVEDAQDKISNAKANAE